MKLKIIKLSDLSRRLLATFIRFPLTVLFILILTAKLIYIVNNDSDIPNMMLFSILSIFVSLDIYLLTEGRKKFWFKNALVFVAVVFVGLYVFTLKNPIVYAEGVRYVMLSLSTFVLLFVLPFVFNNRFVALWKYIRDTLSLLVSSFFFGGVLMLGLSLAIVSMDKLFGVNIPTYTYDYLAIFCFVLFSSLYFISSIPNMNLEKEDDNKYSISRFLKILALYILIPILLVYVVILYLYMFKIIFTWELPNGWISWLVSVFGVVGYFTYYLVRPYQFEHQNSKVEEERSYKLSLFYTNYFTMIILPLLVLMFVGIMRRIVDYDFTINRLLVLLFNIWMFGISIYYTISKKKTLKWIFISLSTVLFLSAVGPWSVMSISKKRFTDKFEDLLLQAGWTNSKDDKLTVLSKEKQSNLMEVSKYLENYWGVETIRPFFSRLGENATISDLQNALNISLNDNHSKTQYFSYDQFKSLEFDISDYQSSIYLVKSFDKSMIYKSDLLTVRLEGADLLLEKNNKTLKASLLPQIEWIIEKQSPKNDLKEKDLIIKINDYKLIIYNLSGTYEGETILIDNFQALLLIP
jgi:hypothetical protein